MSPTSGGLIHAVSTVAAVVDELLGAVGVSICGGSSMIAGVTPAAVAKLQTIDVPTNARNCNDVRLMSRMSPPAVEMPRRSVGRIVAMSRIRARASVTLATAR